MGQNGAGSIQDSAQEALARFDLVRPKEKFSPAGEKFYDGVDGGEGEGLANTNEFSATKKTSFSSSSWVGREALLYLHCTRVLNTYFSFFFFFSESILELLMLF